MLGYEAKETQQSRDGGVDVIATAGELGISHIFVQVKNQQHPVGEKPMRELAGVLTDKSDTDVGLFPPSFSPLTDYWQMHRYNLPAAISARAFANNPKFPRRKSMPKKKSAKSANLPCLLMSLRQCEPDRKERGAPNWRKNQFSQ